MQHANQLTRHFANLVLTLKPCGSSQTQENAGLIYRHVRAATSDKAQMLKRYALDVHLGAVNVLTKLESVLSAALDLCLIKLITYACPSSSATQTKDGLLRTVHATSVVMNVKSVDLFLSCSAQDARILPYSCFRVDACRSALMVLSYQKIAT